MKLKPPFMTTAKEYLKLCRVRIALLSAFSAASGFILASHRLEMTALGVLGGVFLLSCGCSGMNQYQERSSDSLMPRTRGRPIPSGRVDPACGLCFSLVVIGLGWSVIALASGLVPSVLGLFAIIWYNGVYTCLKKRSAFASVPGAVIGAIPPAIGWVAGGGSLTDPRLLSLCFFFFMWQVPHFWLFILSFGRQYEEAGLPSLTAIFTRRQLERIVSWWIFGVAVSCLSLYRLVDCALVSFSLWGASLWLGWQGIRLIGSHGADHYDVFRKVTYYILAVLLLVTLDHLTTPGAVGELLADVLAAGHDMDWMLAVSVLKL